MIKNTYKTRILFLLSALLLGISSVVGQSYFTVLSTHYAYSSKKNVPKQNSFQNEGLVLNLPINLKNENKLLLGVNGQRVSLRISTIDNQQAYFTSGINLGFLKKTSKGSIIIMGLARLNSDLKLVNEEDFQLGGAILVTRKKNEHFSLKYGLYYNAELFGPFFAPLLGMDWKINDKFRIFGVMPQSLTIENKLNSRVRYGLAYMAPNLTYHLHASNTNLYLHQSQVRAGVFGDFYVSKTIAATLKVDYPFPAKYRIYETYQRYDANIWGIGIGGSRNKQTVPQAALSHGLLFQIGISYRVELN